MTIGAYALKAVGPVSVVAVGTTTPVTVYRDVGGNNAGPNPVPPQGDGTVQIYAAVGDVDLLVPNATTVTRMTVAVA